MEQRRYRNARRRGGRPSDRVLRFAMLFILIITIGLYIVLERSIQFKDDEAVATNVFAPTGVILDFEIEDKADFYVTDKGNFFFCTKDGVRYYSSSGEKKWDRVFNMIRPVIYGEGEMLAVAEPKGRELYVFNAEGLCYSLNFEYPVLRFSVNRIGYVSVILQRNNDYEIHIYDEEGGEPAWQWNNENYNVFPVVSAVSNDGRIAAFSVLDINDVNPTSMIIFAYIDETVHKNKYPDTIFSSKMKENQLIGDLKFMDNGMVISVSGEEIAGMQIVEGSSSTDKVVDSWEIPLSNKIDKISYNEGKGFALAFGEGILNKPSEPVGTVKYYDLNGQGTGAYHADDKISFLWSGANAMIIGTAGSAYAVDVRGRKLWDYKSGLQAKQVMLLGNTNDILAVTATRAELLKR